jgi:putative tricarboxylic transport membrane protein
MFEGLMLGLSTALSVQNIIMVVAGCLIGTFIGMLPGLGPMSIIAIMIPVAISIGDPAAALIMLAGVYYGAIFGGSTSSILINAPGVAGTVATSFDGYPMARKGLAGKALAIAAVSSFFGGTVGVVLLFGFAPALATVALLFHSAEYFALMVVGLSAIAAFAGTGKVAKALLMTIVGLMMATVGESALFNAPRFTMGVQDLQSGFSFVTLAMAIFALPEAFHMVLDPKRSKIGDGTGGEIKGLMITKDEAKKIAPVIGRQSIQGFLIGVMPGAGATIASFLGYAVERNIAKGEDQDEFGKGSIKGLAAPETANNAACTGSFVPLLTLGIPGSGTTAILLGALIALNVAPGPRLMIDRPEIFWAVIVSMYIGNVVLLILNLPLIPYIAKVLAVPRNYLIPFILFFTLMGSYIGQNNATELLILAGLGVVATIIRFADYPLAPLLIGFILGGMLEDNFARAVNITDGVSFMWERPGTLILLIIGVGLIFLPAWRRRRAYARERALARQKGVAEGD